MTVFHEMYSVIVSIINFISVLENRVTNYMYWYKTGVFKDRVITVVIRNVDTNIHKKIFFGFNIN